MDKDIKLSKKHGLNPSLMLCFWCGEAHGVAICGRLKGDAEAPRQMVVDYEPCESCKQKFDTGVALIEVSEVPGASTQPPITAREGTDYYPTGRYIVVNDAGVSAAFLPDMAKTLLEKRRAYLHTEAFAQLMAGFRASGADGSETEQE